MLGAALLLGACDSFFEPIVRQERRVLLHAILDPGADTQSVLLEWTEATNFQVAITGATVRILNAAGQSVTATRRTTALPLPNTAARYVFLQSEGFQLQPGGRYELEVTIPGQPTINGSTTIPSIQPVSQVNVRTFPFIRDLDTLRMTLPRVAGAAGYRMTRFARHATIADFYYLPMAVYTDTAVVLPGTLETFDGDDFFPTQMTVDVVALAVDDNYFVYYRTASDPFAGAPPSRLTGGAVGLFGSVVPIRRHRFPVL